MKTKQKVLAYITRNSSEVLVFLHRDHPEAGLQVPGGTVDPGEDLIEAIIREVFEESGLIINRADIARKIGETDYQRQDIPEINHRHYFLIHTKDLPETWAHTVHSTGADDGLVFLYSWMETSRAKALLTGKMGELLP
jgi:8-oxo-dGTP pyrophosphatase MutT (NUDIX family)